MRCPNRTFNLYAICLLWLSFVPQPVQPWAWGPYNDEWKDHLKSSSQPLMYRVVLPRNGTAPTFSGNGTYNNRPNATGTMPLSTSTPTPLTNSSGLDTTCGVTSLLFTMQVSGANGSMFNNWWLRLSGNMILFTTQKEKATGFGVNPGTRHLCVPRAGALPLIAIIESRADPSPLYFMDANFSVGYQPEYEPIECDNGGGGSQLACSLMDMDRWSGCGMQLEIGSGQGSTVGSLNCSNIDLNTVQS